MFIRRIQLIFKLDRRSLLLFGEAYLYLGLARLLLLRPFAKVAPLLGAKSEETEQHESKDMIVLKRIAHAIDIVSRYTFWDSKCLVKAIAGMKMLERRSIDSTLYLGTAKDEHKKLIAHAWLRSGSLYVTGAEVMQQFVVVEKFANRRTK